MQPPLHSEEREQCATSSPSSSSRSVVCKAAEKMVELHNSGEPHDSEENPASHSSKSRPTQASDSPLHNVVYINFDKPYDRDNPQQWPTSKRIYTGCLMIWLAFDFALLASTYAPLYPVLGPKLQVGHVVFLLGTTTLMTGIALGALLTAPLSETTGRAPIYWVSTLLFAVLIIPQAVGKNIETFVITRFFHGLVNSAGNSMVAGTLADIFPAQARGMWIAGFIVGNYAGQGLGPFFSAAILSGGGPSKWHWAFWYQCIFAFLTFFVILFTFSETRANVILRRRAKRLTEEATERGSTTVYISSMDKTRISLLRRNLRALTLPFRMLFLEPICTAFSIWVGFAWYVPSVSG